MSDMDRRNREYAEKAARSELKWRKVAEMRTEDGTLVTATFVHQMMCGDEPLQEEVESSCIVKWDGCAHYYEYLNPAPTVEQIINHTESKETKEQSMYLHFCGGFEDTIRSLQELHNLAAAIYNDPKEDRKLNDWPDCG